jgi:hypothetical protein
MPFPVWIVGGEKFNVFHTGTAFSLRFPLWQLLYGAVSAPKSAAPNGTLPVQVVTNKSQGLKVSRNTPNDISNKK